MAVVDLSENGWRLLDAVGRMEIPVLLIQPAHDTSPGPARMPGAQAKRRGNQ